MSRMELTRAHGLAWLYLCLHLAAHVVEEALGGFVDVFNPLGVTFPVWIVTLTLAVTALVGVTPLVSRGAHWAVSASYVLGAAMIANGINHLLSPLYLGRFLPGHFTSPLLIAASIWLIVKARAVAQPGNEGEALRQTGMSAEASPQGQAAWPLVGTAIFFVVAGGTVVGWIPYTISGWAVAPPLGGVGEVRVLGAVMMVGGITALVECFLRFALDGHGTPAPVAPPDTLVVSGLYRHTRNPMYVAVLTALTGQALLFGSLALLQYAAVVWIIVHLFVMIYEEPALGRQFGAAYATYRRHVPRWLPRLRPWPGATTRR